MEKSTYEDVRYEVDGLGVTEPSLHAYFTRRANGQQLDQKRYIRPETLARLNPAARFMLDV
jgi:hypothetical protein